jgi:hypothetical protein
MTQDCLILYGKDCVSLDRIRLLDWFTLDGKILLGIVIALLKFGRKIIGWSKLVLGLAGI